MKFKKFFLYLISLCIILLFINNGIAYAGNKDLINFIKHNESLCDGNPDFLINEGLEYLISVGVSPIKDSTPEAKLNAITEAKLIADEGLMKFIYEVQFSSKEELIKEIQTISSGNGEEKIISTEKYIEIIKEKGKGILKGSLNIGKWKSEDKKEYFYAVGVILDQ